MISDRKILAIIPARGGSKGLPNKNIMPVNDRPLLAWTIEAARTSRYIDRVVLSSDDEAIIEAALAHGCDVPFRRPGALASDTAATIDVIFHAIDALPEYDTILVLQPTSPLRTVDDIDAACELLVASGAPSCVSVCIAEQTPYWMYRLDDAYTLVPILDVPAGVSRRQDLPPVYALNGAIYIADVSWLRTSRTFMTSQTVAYVMPADRSLDIDTAADFENFRKIVVGQAPGLGSQLSSHA